MNWDADRFRNVASGIQSIVVAVAVIVGGGWTLYRFIELDEVGQRRAELQQSQRALHERAKLDLRLTAEQLPDTGDGRRFVAVTIDIENKGNRSEAFLWNASALIVAAVTLDANGNEMVTGKREVPFTRVGLQPGEQPISEAVLPGHSRRFPFLVGLDAPGIYHLEFYATASPSEERESTRDHLGAGSDAETYQWTEGTYIHVR